MSPDLDPSDDDPDQDTERFALETCPHCAGLTAVALSFATAACEVCGERFEVTPLPSGRRPLP